MKKNIKKSMSEKNRPGLANSSKLNQFIKAKICYLSLHRNPQDMLLAGSHLHFGVLAQTMT